MIKGQEAWICGYIDYSSQETADLNPAHAFPSQIHLGVQPRELRQMRTQALLEGPLEANQSLIAGITYVDQFRLRRSPFFSVPSDTFGDRHQSKIHRFFKLANDYGVLSPKFLLRVIDGNLRHRMDLFSAVGGLAIPFDLDQRTPLPTVFCLDDKELWLLFATNESRQLGHSCWDINDTMKDEYRNYVQEYMEDINLGYDYLIGFFNRMQVVAYSTGNLDRGLLQKVS
jgi:hypothetical protein